MSLRSARRRDSSWANGSVTNSASGAPRQSASAEASSGELSAGAAWRASSTSCSNRRTSTSGRLGAEQVPARVRLEPPGRQHLPELRHVDLDRLDRRAGGLLAPQRVDQTIAGDDLVRVQGEQRKQGTRLRSAEPKRPVDCARLEGAEQRVFDCVIARRDAQALQSRFTVIRITPALSVRPSRASVPRWGDARSVVPTTLFPARCGGRLPRDTTGVYRRPFRFAGRDPTPIASALVCRRRPDTEFLHSSVDGMNSSGRAVRLT